MDEFAGSQQKPANYMASWIFQTDGNYVNFNGGGNLWRLHKDSNCISWHWDETGDLFFDVYDAEFSVKAENIGHVIIDGAPLAAAADFPTAIKAVFTGLGSGEGGGSGYLSYVALLSQSSTDAPTAVVLANTLGGTLVWSYDSTGLYIGTLAGAFPDANKIFMIFGNGNSPNTFIGGGFNDTNSIYISTNGGDENPNNGLLQSSSIEIRVYP